MYVGIKGLKYLILSVFLAFSILFLSTTALASVSLNVSATPVGQSNNTANLANTNITIFGSIINTTTSDTIAGINISATIGSNTNWNVTPANGVFKFNVTAPTAVGEYTFNVTNNGSLPTKTFTIYVSNTTSGKIGYIEKFPPFTNSTTFKVNITLYNGTSTLSNYNYVPSVEIFKSNGQRVSWTVTNLSAVTNSTGSIAYNITVPSDASANEYAIVVDRGVAFSIFRVGSSYQIAVNTRTTSEEVASNFAPGSTVDVLAKIRTTSGDPVTGATVTAVITYPNKTRQNITLTAHPSSEGFYNTTFTDTSNSGEYDIKVGAIVGGDTVTGSGILNTKGFEARMEPVKEFFFEWGGQGAFKPGDTVALDVVAINLTDGSIFNWNSCPVANYTWIDVYFVNGTSVNSSTTNWITDGVFSTDAYLPGTTVCKVQFTAPSTTGTYGVKANVTIGSEIQTAEGFFRVQNYFLKVSPKLSLGGFDEFKMTVAPGENITLELKGVNTSSNEALLPQNITDFSVTNVVPLEFTTGVSEITTLNQTSYNGTNPGSYPNVTLQLPTSIFGPLLIEVTATINGTGETVTGNTFLISNYLNGFIGPQGGNGGDGGSDGFMPFLQCSGTQTFSGRVYDSKTGTAAQGASIINFVDAREETTGKDITDFLSINSSTASDSNGEISVNLTFASSGYTFAEEYFVVFNVSYKGKIAGLPGFFICKNLNMGFPQVQTYGTNETFSWQVSPTSALSVTLTNVSHMNGTKVDSTAVFSMTQIFNFNPSTGSMQVLVNNTPLQISFDSSGTYPSITSNNATLVIYPQNFSVGGTNLTKWPNGFFDLRPRVIWASISDTGWSGFQVVAFDAFPEQFGFGAVPAGSIKSTIINSRANIGNGTENVIYVQNSSFDNNTAFTIKIGRPWEGELTEITNINATLLSDGWNYTGNTSFERWNVTYLIPSTLRKGGAELSITLNGTVNATGSTDYNEVTVPLWVSITKYNILIPREEGVGNPESSQMDDYFVPANGMWPDSEFGPELTQKNASQYGWDLNYINTIYAINSTSGRVCVKNTFNSTRYIEANRYNIHINDTAGTRILVIDSTSNPTSGYNTVILNRSGEITIVNTTNAASRVIGGGLYLWNIEHCGYFTIVNTTTSGLLAASGNTWGGHYEMNSNFSIPYAILSASNVPQEGATVTIASMGLQDNRGFGFESRVGSSNFTASTATTDANGVGFVTLNVSQNGRMVAFWKVTVEGDTDTASMDSATFLDIKRFRTYSEYHTVLPLGVVTLTNDTSGGGAWGMGSGQFMYNATINETNARDFTTDNEAGLWYIGYNATSRQIMVTNVTAQFQEENPSYVNSTNSIDVWNTMVGGLKVGGWTNDTLDTAPNTITALLFRSDSEGNTMRTVTNATENISIAICAQGFQKPTAVPVENATVNLTVTDWSTYPPTTKYVDVYKLIDHSRASPSNPAVTSPSGCVFVNIGPGQLGTWPSSRAGKPPVFIEGTITDMGGNVENAYVADVFRP